MDSPVKWVGSKRLIRRRICAMIPAGHDTYVEPFAGSAAVFFFKNTTRMGNVPKPSTREVISDVDPLLMNFYRVIQDPDTISVFLERLESSLVARDLFMAYRESSWEELDVIEKAFRMYYIVKVAYGGLFRFNKAGACNSPIASTPDKKARSFLFKTGPLLAAHDRLQGVHLHEWDYARVIEMYDAPGTVFYLDPPYETEYKYNKSFDHDELARVLRRVQGRFILSLNEEFEAVFAGFHVDRVSVNYSVTCKQGDNQRGEIIVRNYDLRPAGGVP